MWGRDHGREHVSKLELLCANSIIIIFLMYVECLLRRLPPSIFFVYQDCHMLSSVPSRGPSRSYSTRITTRFLSFVRRYPASVREALSLFACEPRGPDLSVLSSDHGVRCYTTNHLVWMTGVGVPALGCFCFLLPALAVLKLHSIVRRGLLDEQSVVRQFGFLFRGPSWYP